MQPRELTAPTQAALLQALLAAGVMQMTETAPVPANGAVVSWITTAPDADAAALVALDETLIDTVPVWAALQAGGASVSAQLESRRVLWGVAPDPTSVPTQVTMRQARLALLGAGMLPAVTAALAALPEPQKSAANIEWEYSTAVQRNRGIVVSMGTALGMTNAQLDALFIAAGNIA